MILYFLDPNLPESRHNAKARNANSKANEITASHIVIDMICDEAVIAKSKKRESAKPAKDISCSIAITIFFILSAR